jgi:hypothetical protein
VIGRVDGKCPYVNKWFINSPPRGLSPLATSGLDLRLNADIPDTGGRTPLSHAAEHGLGDIIQLLLDSNANINLEDKRCAHVLAEGIF